jgi:hypothetical protein
MKKKDFQAALEFNKSRGNEDIGAGTRWTVSDRLAKIFRHKKLKFRQPLCTVIDYRNFSDRL